MVDDGGDFGEKGVEGGGAYCGDGIDFEQHGERGQDQNTAADAGKPNTKTDEKAK